MKINLGSGQRPFLKPWLNVDCQERWNPDVIADGASMPMFEDGSAEMIVLHHVLEHFNLGNADAMILECNRILKQGGSLIITVPDMRALAQRWLTRQIDDYTFMVNTYGAYMGASADCHKWGFCAESLKDYLLRFGKWSKVIRFDWREISGASICKDWWILGMEAIK